MALALSDNSKGTHIWSRPSHQDATVSMVSPANPSSFNATYLQNVIDTQITPCPVPGDMGIPYPRGSDLYGWSTAKKITTPPIPPQEYNATYLRNTVNTQQTPVPELYTKAKAIERASPEDTEDDSQKLDPLSIAKLIYETIPKSDAKKKSHWLGLIERLTKLNMISQIRPLKPEEAQLQSNIMAEIGREKENIEFDMTQPAAAAAKPTPSLPPLEPISPKPEEKPSPEQKEQKFEKEQKSIDIDEFKRYQHVTNHPQSITVNQWKSIAKEFAIQLTKDAKLSKKPLVNQIISNALSNPTKNPKKTRLITAITTGLLRKDNFEKALQYIRSGTPPPTQGRGQHGSGSLAEKHSMFS